MGLTAREVYELAQKLPKRERKKLLKWLERDLERESEKVGKVKRAVKTKVRDPLADDPWFTELREVQKRAEEALGLSSVEEIMTWLRGRPWRFDE